MLDLRTATQEQLIELPGIGPILANRIIRYREHGDQFRRESDLLRVKGIGEKLLDRLRPLVTVRGPKHVAETTGIMDELGLVG